MRTVYADEATLQAEAKKENTKVSVVALADTPFVAIVGNYYKGATGNFHRQLARMDNGHVLFSGVFVHVDDPVPMGTAGSLRMPRTASVLSVPRADIGETLSGYYIRTSKQHGGDPMQVGVFLDLVKRTAPDVKDGTAKVITDASGTKIVFVPQRTGDPLIDWPLLVDTFANPGAYAILSTQPLGAGVLTAAVPVPTAPVPAPATMPPAAPARTGAANAAGLSRTYATPFAFKSATQIYTGGIRIEADGAMVREGSTPAIVYVSKGVGTDRSYSTTDSRVA